MREPSYRRFLGDVWDSSPGLIDFARQKLVDIDDYEKMATELETYFLEMEQCTQQCTEQQAKRPKIAQGAEERERTA